MTVTEPVVTEYTKENPKVSAQKLVIIPKDWNPYFMDPLSPW